MLELQAFGPLNRAEPSYADAVYMRTPKPEGTKEGAPGVFWARDVHQNEMSTLLTANSA